VEPRVEAAIGGNRLVAPLAAADVLSALVAFLLILDEYL
jgi:hypothetical protein